MHDFSSTLKVRTLKTVDEVRANQMLWNWPGTRDSDLEFFLDTCEKEAQIVRPQVLVACRNASPEAMLIGKLEQRQIPIKLGCLGFTTPQIPVLHFVYGPMRGSEARETTEILVSEVVKKLRCGEADIALFEHLPVNSQLWRTLGTLPEHYKVEAVERLEKYRAVKMQEVEKRMGLSQ